MSMPIGWEGLSMSTGEHFGYMPIIIINSRFRGVEQDSVLYVMKFILTHIPLECGVVDPYIDRFLNGSD